MLLHMLLPFLFMVYCNSFDIPITVHLGCLHYFSVIDNVVKHTLCVLRIPDVKGILTEYSIVLWKGGSNL